MWAGERGRGPRRCQAQGHRGHLVGRMGLGLGLGHPEELTARNWEATLLGPSQKWPGSAGCGWLCRHQPRPSRCALVCSLRGPGNAATFQGCGEDWHVCKPPDI